MLQIDYSKLLIMFFLVSCQGAESQNNSSSDDAVNDDETGASVYVPEGREDVEVTSGADVANDTTGAYLSMPDTGISSAGASVNISNKKEISDEKVNRWRMRIPLTESVKPSLGDNFEKLGIFYHVKRSDGNYYGFISQSNPNVEISASGEYVFFTLNGLGNYQPGVLPNSVGDDREVKTTDEIYKKSVGNALTSSIFVDGSKVYAGVIRNKIHVASDYNSSFTKKENGLKGSAIRDVTKSADNVLYVATNHGFGYSTDDGNSFTMVDVSTSGLPHRNVFAIATGSDSKVYVATEGGVAIFTSQAASVVGRYTKDNGLPDASITSIAVGTDHAVYVGSQSGAYKKTDSGTTFSLLVDAAASGLCNSEYSKSVESLFVDSSNRVFVATADSICYTDATPTTNSIEKERSIVVDGKKVGTVRDIWVDNSERVYLASSNGMFSFKMADSATASETKYFDAGLGSEGAYSVFVPASGDIYIGHDQGMKVISASHAELKDIKGY